MEKLVRTHTNPVMRESLDDVLHHLLPWDIELIIDDPVDDPEEEPKEPFFSEAYHVTWVNWIKHKKNPNDVYREKETFDRHFF